MSDADAALETALQSLVGGQGSVQVATEPVGASEVSAWCAVMSEANPLFVDEAVAASGP